VVSNGKEQSIEIYKEFAQKAVEVRHSHLTNAREQIDVIGHNFSVWLKEHGHKFEVLIERKSNQLFKKNLNN